MLPYTYNRRKKHNNIYKIIYKIVYIDKKVQVGNDMEMAQSQWKSFLISLYLSLSFKLFISGVFSVSCCYFLRLFDKLKTILRCDIFNTL